MRFGSQPESSRWTHGLAPTPGARLRATLVKILNQLGHLPLAVAKVLELGPAIKEWAPRFAGTHHVRQLI